MWGSVFNKFYKGYRRKYRVPVEYRLGLLEQEGLVRETSFIRDDFTWIVVVGLFILLEKRLRCIGIRRRLRYFIKSIKNINQTN